MTPLPPPPAFAELAAASNFSFLRGASHPEELVLTAAAFGAPGIAVCDRNTLAGVVRAHLAGKEVGVRTAVGCRLVFRDGTPDILAWPTDRAAYGRLCRLLTVGNLRGEKNDCRLDLADLAEWCDGLVLALVAETGTPETIARAAATLAPVATEPLRLAINRPYGPDDQRALLAWTTLARRLGLRPLATNLPLYHAPDRRPLQDVLTAVREHTTVDAAGRLLAANAERHLKPPAEMARLFADVPEALAETIAVLDRLTFRLDELRYEYPEEPTDPGRTPHETLVRLTWGGARERYPGGVPASVRAQVEHELSLIEGLDYAPYFLTVHDIVRYARDNKILAQGRGSAANSAVCYCLGVTEVDPERSDLLFERFISPERREPPDIDVDFEHERREEVIQYIYQKYSRDRAGIAATVITYRARSAAREIGKALGFSEDAVSALAGSIWGWSAEGVGSGEAARAGLDPSDPRIAHLIRLSHEIAGFPRHLSQHVGGFVITRGRLDEFVPIVKAAMDDRTNIEWDKDDLDSLGILKIDVLALGMLTCVRKSFDFLRTHYADHFADPAVDDARAPISSPLEPVGSGGADLDGSERSALGAFYTTDRGIVATGHGGEPARCSAATRAERRPSAPSYTASDIDGPPATPRGSRMAISASEAAFPHSPPIVPEESEIIPAPLGRASTTDDVPPHQPSAVAGLGTDAASTPSSTAATVIPFPRGHAAGTGDDPRGRHDPAAITEFRTGAVGLRTLTSTLESRGNLPADHPSCAPSGKAQPIAEVRRTGASIHTPASIRAPGGNSLADHPSDPPPGEAPVVAEVQGNDAGVRLPTFQAPAASGGSGSTAVETPPREAPPLDPALAQKQDTAGRIASPAVPGTPQPAPHVAVPRHRAGISIAGLPHDDPEVYDMICRADTLGVFQIESRAQMTMLPRLRPRNFYDLVIEVAIVRPGPIQGDMVHPYLRRRQGKEKPTYPSEELREVLAKTLGVPLFQEQAMRIAMVAAGFTPSEADQLRRAMATFKKVGTIGTFQQKMIDGMVRRGYDQTFAERCFRQIEGFGEYGFPESHAASFAILVYASCWLKCHYPDVFCAALLNSQPMGFYAPAQIVRDARRHGVEVRPVDINRSDWDCTLEPGPPAAERLAPEHAEMRTAIRSCCAVRLGLRQVKGLGEDDMRRLVARRGAGYDTVRDLWLRTGLPRATIERLADADAFGSIGLNRRDALWAARGLDPAGRAEDLPLFAAADTADLQREAAAALPPMPPGEEVINDYRFLSLSLKAHPIGFVRAALAAERVVPAEGLARHANGQRLAVAGLVLVRQRPGSAKGVIFMTLEDETGIANVIVWPKIFEAHRQVVLGARFLKVTGRMQAQDGVVHVVAERLEDRTPLLEALTEPGEDWDALDRADEVKRPGVDLRTRISPRSRLARLIADTPELRGEAAAMLASHRAIVDGLAAHRAAADAIATGRTSAPPDASDPPSLAPAPAATWGTARSAAADMSNIGATIQRSRTRRALPKGRNFQ